MRTTLLAILLLSACAEGPTEADADAAWSQFQAAFNSEMLACEGVTPPSSWMHCRNQSRERAFDSVGYRGPARILFARLGAARYDLTLAAERGEMTQEQAESRFLVYEQEQWAEFDALQRSAAAQDAALEAERRQRAGLAMLMLGQSMQTYRPTTTNCTGFGATLNCTTW